MLRVASLSLLLLLLSPSLRLGPRHPDSPVAKEKYNFSFLEGRTTHLLPYFSATKIQIWLSHYITYWKKASYHGIGLGNLRLLSQGIINLWIFAITWPYTSTQ